MGCREGGLDKEPKCIRISFQRVDSKQNSQLIGLRRLYSEFTMSRWKYSPLTGTSLTSALKNAEHTERERERAGEGGGVQEAYLLHEILSTGCVQSGTY